MRSKARGESLAPLKSQWKSETKRRTRLPRRRELGRVAAAVQRDGSRVSLQSHRALDVRKRKVKWRGGRGSNLPGATSSHSANLELYVAQTQHCPRHCLAEPAPVAEQVPVSDVASQRPLGPGAVLTWLTVVLLPKQKPSVIVVALPVTFTHMATVETGSRRPSWSRRAARTGRAPRAWRTLWPRRAGGACATQPARRRLHQDLTHRADVADALGANRPVGHELGEFGAKRIGNGKDRLTRSHRLAVHRHLEKGFVAGQQRRRKRHLPARMNRHHP